MRNITIGYKDKTCVSLSHWGLFVAEKIAVNNFQITGYDEYNEPVRIETEAPVYQYRSIVNGESDIMDSYAPFKFVSKVNSNFKELS